MSTNQITKQGLECAYCKKEKEIVAVITFKNTGLNEDIPTLPSQFCKECFEIVKTWGKIGND